MEWPSAHIVFGVEISATTYDEAAELILEAAQNKCHAIIAHAPVHLLILASRNDDLRDQLNLFDIVAPDGQPVRWALRVLHEVRLPDRVYGPEMMLRLCERSAQHGIGVYLYGVTCNVIERLRINLRSRFPALRIVGYESPPFRPLTVEEDEAAVSRINSSGAGIVFLGLGCPQQERFAYEHRDRIRAVQVCVGAAFDFHSGTKRMAPRWMQRHGLEWLFRLSSEPRRLWRRYLYTNSLFVWWLARDLLFRSVRTQILRRASRSRSVN